MSREFQGLDLKEGNMSLKLKSYTDIELLWNHYEK